MFTVLLAETLVHRITDPSQITYAFYQMHFLSLTSLVENVTNVHRTAFF